MAVFSAACLSVLADIGALKSVSRVFFYASIVGSRNLLAIPVIVRKESHNRGNIADFRHQQPLAKSGFNDNPPGGDD
jgi:hypothetical protein